MRRIVICGISACLLLTLTGCWNRTELNELGITTETGVDWENGEWALTVQEIVPSAMTSGMGGAAGGSSSQSAVHTFTTRGITLRDALMNNDLEHPRLLYLAHNNVLVIGQEAARQGIVDILDFFYRSPEARITTQVVVADRPARDILKQYMPPEHLPGAAIATVLRKEGRFSSIFPPVSLFDVSLRLTSASKTAGIPVITIAGSGDSGLEKMQAYQSTSTSSKLKLSRLAVIREGRLAGWMNGKESRGVSWISGQMNSTVVTYACPGSSDPGVASVRVNKAKSHVTVRKQGDAYRVRVTVKASGELEQYGCMADLKKLGTIRQAERRISQAVKEEIEAGWEAQRRLKADAAGFGNILHRSYPKSWKKLKASWNDRLDEVEMETKVSFRIRGQGQDLNSFRKLLGT